MRIRTLPLIGLLVGVAAPAAYLAPEFFDRIQWAASGGRGERAVWGEPLFYLAVAAIPCGIVGMLAGWVLAKIRVLLRR
jgi:hypothetical protein